MHCVGVLDQPRRYAVPREPAGIGTSVVAQWITSGREDQRGRETGEGFGPEWHGGSGQLALGEVLRVGPPTGGDAEEGAVEQPVRLGVLVDVEARVAEDLAVGERRTLVPREQAGAGGECGTRTLPADRNPAVAIQLEGVFAEPVEGVPDVVKSCWIRVFGCDAIVE